MNYEVISPVSSAELLNTLNNLNGKNYRIGAGYTDLILELKRSNKEKLTIINLAKIEEDSFSSIKEESNLLRIGSLVTVHELVINDFITKNFPTLAKSASELASPQIRQLATVGGNLCTASPAGDVACALMALDTMCFLLSSNGTTRSVHINHFFAGTRKTVLKPGEVLQYIEIPYNNDKKDKIQSGFIKVGIRRSMECAVVSLAYHIGIDKNDTIIHAGIAVGSVAPTVLFTESACTFLIGKSFSSIKNQELEEFAHKILAYASPISDIRGSAWYRKEVLYNICKTIFIK